jgi:hypothetical protein
VTRNHPLDLTLNPAPATAAAGGAAEALAEAYTGHLRRIASLGLSDSPAAAALRDALRTLRDIPRAPEDAPHVGLCASGVCTSKLSTCTAL